MATNSTKPAWLKNLEARDSANNKSNTNQNNGGSSGGNSQYTKPTLGNTWDANTDYQAIINNAVANSDYVTAAKAEQLRNQKITATGSNYDTTNNYKGWLDSTDYGTIGRNQMANGAGWQDVLDTYNSRYNKANGTVGLEDYKDDQLMKMMQNYIYYQQELEKYQNVMDDFEQENQRPTQPERDPRIDALLNEILNRDDFSAKYDVMKDPLYQQYAQMYQREGDRAMKETMAESAAGAGGMNTYAITAAQQANSYYNSQLNDKIPQLYQLAYDMYLNDIENEVQNLGILQNMDATQYNRYRDTLNDWYNDKNFAYGVYQDAVQQGNYQNNFNYNSMLNNRDFMNNNYWKEKEFNANQGQLDLENSRYDQERAYNQVMEYIKNGVTTISPDLIKKAGLDQVAVNQMIAQYQAENAPRGTSSGGGGRSGYSGAGGYTGGDDEGEPTGNTSWIKGMSDLGLMAGHDVNILVDLEEAGAIYESNGKLMWADGWNANNFQAKLKMAKGTLV